MNTSDLVNFNPVFPAEVGEADAASVVTATAAPGDSSSPTRRNFLGTLAAVAAFGRLLFAAPSFGEAPSA
jgi:hypothetical protein